MIKQRSKEHVEIDNINKYLTTNHKILIDLKKNDEKIENDVYKLNNQQEKFFTQVNLLNKKLIEIISEIRILKEKEYESEKLYIDLIYILNNIYPLIYNLKENEKTLILKTLNLIEEIFSESKEIKIIKPKLLQKFNPNEHEVVDFVETNICKNENKISAILGLGYYRRGKIVKKAKVQLYKCKAFDE